MRVFMPVIRTEFFVKGDLVFPDDGDRELFRSSEVTVRLRNAKLDEEGHVPGVTAIVIGPASDLRSSVDEHRAVLAAKLDYLALTTRSRFRIHHAERAIEWEPGPGRRRMLALLEKDGRYPPLPNLETRFFSTMKQLTGAQAPPYLATALKYFRYGLLDENPEDQFIRFWHAIEVIAVNTTERRLISVSCHSCKEGLVCAECGSEAKRHPFPKDAILQVIANTGVPNAERLFETLLAARNSLMHGGDSSSVEKRCKRTIAEIVNDLGTIVQAAALKVMEPKGSIFIAHGGELGSYRLMARMEIEFPHDGPEDHPSEDQLPNPDIRVQHSLREGD
jgi:hypothetical protein